MVVVSEHNREPEDELLGLEAHLGGVVLAVIPKVAKVEEDALKKPVRRLSKARDFTRRTISSLVPSKWIQISQLARHYLEVLRTLLRTKVAILLMIRKMESFVLVNTVFQ